MRVRSIGVNSPQKPPPSDFIRLEDIGQNHNSTSDVLGQVSVSALRMLDQCISLTGSCLYSLLYYEHEYYATCNLLLSPSYSPRI